MYQEAACIVSDNDKISNNKFQVSFDKQNIRLFLFKNANALTCFRWTLFHSKLILKFSIFGPQFVAKIYNRMSKYHKKNIIIFILPSKYAQIRNKSNIHTYMQHSGGGDPSLLLRLVETCLVFELFVWETNLKKKIVCVRVVWYKKLWNPPLCTRRPHAVQRSSGGAPSLLFSEAGLSL